MTDAPDPKLVASLQARAALMGYVLELRDGAFIFSRWGLVSAATNASGVEAFLARVEAKPRQA